MGLFDTFKKTTPTTATTTPSDFQTTQHIKLTKGKENLSKAIKLTKEKTGVDLSTLKVRVVFVMDKSGSMEDLFKFGDVQGILTDLLPAAIMFDDDGEAEVYVFSTDCQRVTTPMTEANFDNYVKKYIINKFPYGGTQYAPAITMTDRQYNDSKSKTLPTLVFFITDGDNFDSDKYQTTQAIIESAKHGIFYQFIGIGNARFPYLEELDDLDGRECDNTGFMKVKDFKKADTAEIFLNSLKDFVPWLRTKGFIK